ncbi:hypothetical protein T492DRAFT_860162, partial [Pavlovales sp. CCMP2436]
MDLWRDRRPCNQSCTQPYAPPPPATPPAVKVPRTTESPTSEEQPPASPRDVASAHLAAATGVDLTLAEEALDTVVEQAAAERKAAEDATEAGWAAAELLANAEQAAKEKKKALIKEKQAAENAAAKEKKVQAAEAKAQAAKANEEARAQAAEAAKEAKAQAAKAAKEAKEAKAQAAEAKAQLPHTDLHEQKKAHAGVNAAGHKTRPKTEATGTKAKASASSAPPMTALGGRRVWSSTLGIGLGRGLGRRLALSTPPAVEAALTASPAGWRPPSRVYEALRWSANQPGIEQRLGPSSGENDTVKFWREAQTITQHEARSQYFLTSADLAPLPHMLNAGLHAHAAETEASSIALYFRMDVMRAALARWGSMDNIARRKQHREIVRKRRQTRRQQFFIGTRLKRD